MHSKTPPAPADAPAPVPPAESRVRVILLRPLKNMIRNRGFATLRYLTQTEAHTFAFSVAANAILCFFPFIFLLTWLIGHVFSSRTMGNVIIQLINDHLPLRNQAFLTDKLSKLLDPQKKVK